MTAQADLCRHAVDEGLAIAQTSGIQVLNSRMTICKLQAAMLDGDAAQLEQCRTELESFQPQDNNLNMTNYYFCCAMLALLRNDTACAASCIEAAETPVMKIGSYFHECLWHIGKARVLFAQKKAMESLMHVAKALRLSLRIKSSNLEYMSLLTTAWILLSQKDDGKRPADAAPGDGARPRARLRVLHVVGPPNGRHVVREGPGSRDRGGVRPQARPPPSPHAGRGPPRLRQLALAGPGPCPGGIQHRGRRHPAAIFRQGAEKADRAAQGAHRAGRRGKEGGTDRRPALARGRRGHGQEFLQDHPPSPAPDDRPRRRHTGDGKGSWSSTRASSGRMSRPSNNCSPPPRCREKQGPKTRRFA